MSRPEANQEAAEHGELPGASLKEGGLGSPERSAREWGIALLLFAFSVLFLWPFRSYTVLYSDEGIILEGAQRIIRGQVLYRDFFTFFTPGSYYWTALRFKILGTSFFSGRVAVLLYGGIFSFSLYMLARRVSSRWMAALTAYLFLVIGLPYRFLVLHNWDSAVLALLALYAAIGWVQSFHWVWAIATGTLVSLTCLFEQSKGAGLVVGLTAGLLIVARFSRAPRIFARANIFAVYAGIACPALFTFAYFAQKGAFLQMVSAWFWPLSHYSRVNRLPYGYIPLPYGSWEALYGSGSVLRRLFYILITSPFFIVPFLPLLAAAILVLVLFRLRRGGSLSLAHSFLVLVATCSLGLVLGAFATGRPDADHLIYIAPPLILLLGVVVDGRNISSSLLSRLKPLLAAFLLVTFTAFGMIFLVTGPFGARRPLKTRRGHIEMSCCDAVIPYLQGHIPRGQSVFVYPYQPLYYFLTDIHSPTKFDFLQLGLHTQEQMSQAIADLEADHTRTVVYAPGFNIWVIVSTPPRVLDSDPVRDYIFGHYSPCATLPSLGWSYVILARKGLPCPGESVPGRGTDRGR